MAVFGGLALTNKGRSIFTKAQTGKELKIKRVAIGDGELGNTESMLELEQLKNEIVSFNIANIKTINNKIAKITFILKNANIDEGFYWRELGVIAEDPDTKQEILYCYGNARDNGDYIGAGGGADVLEKYINIDLIIENVQNVTAVIDDSAVFINKSEFDSTIEQINEQISEHKRDVATSFVNMDSTIRTFIPETITNENGTALKFLNGTMICTKSVVFRDVPSITANGSIFTTAQLSLGNFAEEFTDMPIMTVSKVRHDPAWIYNTNQISKTSAGYVTFATTTTRSTATFECHVIAVGKWKQVD